MEYVLDGVDNEDDSSIIIRIPIFNTTKYICRSFLLVELYILYYYLFGFAAALIV